MYPVLSKGDICDILGTVKDIEKHYRDMLIEKLKKSKRFMQRPGLSKGCTCNISGNVKEIKLKLAGDVEGLTFVYTHGCNVMGG